MSAALLVDSPGSATEVTPRSAIGREASRVRTDIRLTSVFVVLLVVTQRFGAPAGGSTSISIAIPLAYLYAGIMIYRGRLLVSRLRLELMLPAVAACLVVTAVVGIRGQMYSLPSLLLLVVIYLPWLLRSLAGRGEALVNAAGRTFVATMVVASVVGIGQLAAQLLGVWTWTDYLLRYVPNQVLVLGYNTTNELSYGSGTYKANAFLFLEPSLMSQFCALAVVVGLMLRVRPWRLLVLVGGLASAVSGTGIILLAAGGVLVVVRARSRLRPAYVVGLGAALAAVLVSPVATVLLARRDELTQPGSSGYARFVEPYTAALHALNADPIRYLVGAGPGTASTLLPGSSNGLGDDVLYSIVPKLVFEYGLLAGGLFAVFLVVASLDGARWRVVPGALLIMTFVLSGALLQPQTAYLVWVLSGLGATERLSRPRRRVLVLRPPRRRPASAPEPESEPEPEPARG